MILYNLNLWCEDHVLRQNAALQRRHNILKVNATSEGELKHHESDSGVRSEGGVEGVVGLMAAFW